MRHQYFHSPAWACALLFLLLLVIPISATAYDQVGIYFDDDYQTYAINVPQPNTIVTGYLVLDEPATGAGVAGWELCVDIDGPAIFLNWELEGQTINIDTPPCFIVGVGDAPLPGQERVLLATFTMMVQEALPIVLTVQPVYHASIPGEMAYLTHEDPPEIRPLYSATGEPEVAWINQGVPVAQVEPPDVHFGEIPVDSTEERIVSVSNIGGGALVLDIDLVGGSGAFHLPTISGSHTVFGGHTLEIPIIFHPDNAQFYEGILTLGSPLAPNVMVRGNGREPIVAWDVVSELVFDETVVGGTFYKHLTISNIGEVPIPIEPTLPADCTAFSITNPAPGVVITPGSQVVLTLAFSPQEEGMASCQLDLGSIVDSVALSGYGYLPFVDYSVTPAHLVFPDVGVGMSLQRIIVLRNTGDAALDLDIHLMEPSMEFEIISGQGLLSLEPGDEMLITLSFTPSDVGTFGNEVVFGHEIIANVPVSGSGVEIISSCLVTPAFLDFGIMAQGSVYTQYLTVRNDGNVEFPVTPVVNCPSTTITPHDSVLQPGHSQIFTVAHQATAVGPWECLITLGQNVCSEVPCSGIVESGAAWHENRVGLFFDDDYSMSETEMIDPGTLVTHLVLLNPTDPVGISGWECRFELVGQSWLLVGSDIMGQAINVGESPDFIVGLGVPLPWAPAIHLADFQLFMLESYSEAHLHLLPVLQPSIPGEMAFLSADLIDIIPMRPIAGESVVAWVNISMVDVQAPAPEVVMHGNRVQLSWDVPSSTDANYLIYRRGETGPAEVLFEQPLAPANGQFSYSDYPVGFAEGAVLHYSYAVLEDGAELARSPETDIRIQGLPLALTRLLPNVPNPFNPMTEVHFEMENAGSVRLSIYDVSGRMVKTLVHEHMSAGLHSRMWQGRDSSGRQVPSGAYYLRMESGSSVDHRKIMLLK